MDNDLLIKMQAFNRDKDVMRLDRMFQNSSILEIVGVERKETRHSKFLKWLFNVPEINTVSNYSPIMHLLDVLVRRDEEQNNVLDDELKESVITRHSSIRIDDVNLELPTKGLKVSGKEGRIDIYIKASDLSTGKQIHICLENKVYSDEHDNQTWKYYAYMTGDTEYLKKQDIGSTLKGYQCPTNKDDITLFVFLTPSAEYTMKDKDSLKRMCDCNKFVHVNYQDIVSEILEPLVLDDATPQAVKEKIEQYICTLGIPGSAFAEEKAKGGKSKNEEDKASITAMAAGTELLCLSKQVYERYEDLLGEIIFSKDESVLGNFKKNHRDFISKTLCITMLAEEDERTYFEKQMMTLRVNDKNNNYLVRYRGRYRIFSQKEFAIEFAKLYCEKKPVSPINDAQKAVDQLNYDFSKVKGATNKNNLFTTDSTSSLYDCVANPSVFFANNIWGTGTYLEKLEDFIGKQQVVSTEDFEIIRS